jgi:hypothetical protein
MTRFTKFSRNLLVLVAIASPAGALLTDQESSNNSIATAAIQLTPGVTAISDAGVFTFTAGGGDTDYLGIGGLVAGDIVTVSTTPLADPPNLEHPDTIVGLFDSTQTMLCVFDDAFNNQLDAFPMGFGSLCRFEVPVDGDYFVGVTGYSAAPFDGAHFEAGAYTLTVTITPLPEPGVMLQLAAGVLGVAALPARRHRRARGAGRRAIPFWDRAPGADPLT